MVSALKSTERKVTPEIVYHQIEMSGIFQSFGKVERHTMIKSLSSFLIALVLLGLLGSESLLTFVQKGLKEGLSAKADGISPEFDVATERVVECLRGNSPFSDPLKESAKDHVLIPILGRVGTSCILLQILAGV